MAQPTGQDQAAQQTPQPQSQGRPWDNDLAFIENPDLRSSVSDYLAKTWQPRMTQLEQQSKPAVEFFEEFRENPGSATLDVIEELYGEDAAKRFADYLTEQYGQPAPEDQQPPAETPPQPQQLDPRLERLLEREQEQEDERVWAEALKQLQAAHTDIEIDDHLFRPFAQIANGDLEQALEGYKSFVASAQEKFGGPATATQEPEYPAPPALGGGQGGSPVPTEPQNQTLGEAIEGFVADLRAQRQSPVLEHPES